ncbi:MAG: DUF881 domain-containing protein [Clostridiaceae bacterium]|jgi:uncharacterized protein YlxW (UPF0749 family)|nr:DUF881 domain-containing protein [Clostridiaceae bacterium]
MKQALVRNVALTAVCVILGVLIALQMKNVNLSNLREENIAELQTKLIDLINKNNELAERNAELYDYVQILENDKASGNAQIESIVREKERAAIFAGLREVRNYGIVITVQSGEGIDIRDSVLRQFVNELRNLGAQAVSINDERLVATSEIRSSGSNLIINGNNYSRQEPFEIKAITDPKNETSILDYLDTVKRAILADGQIQSDQYSIQISPVPELTVPALNEDSIAFKIDLLMPKSS